MNKENNNINQERVIEEAYRVIRRKISAFNDNSNNDEIAGFVKGVVSLQTQLWGLPPFD